jgi:hypothetical protein
MRLRFTKFSDKQPTLTCIRDDGTTTWFQSETNGDFFVYHDLTHYAVESVMGYTKAFFGLVKAGRDLNDFNTDGETMVDLDPEASYAELFAGILSIRTYQADHMQAPESAIAYADVIQTIVDRCAEFELPAPVISEEKYNAVVALQRELHQRWQQTEPGSALELDL